MGYEILQCSDMSCNRYMIALIGTKTKRCPYCGKRNKVVDNSVNRTEDSFRAREIVKKLNSTVY